MVLYHLDLFSSYVDLFTPPFCKWIGIIGLCVVLIRGMDFLVSFPQSSRRVLFRKSS